MPNQLPELILVFSLIVSVLFIVLGVVLIVTRVFKFTSDLIGLVEKDRTKEADQIKADANASAKKILEEANITSLNTIRESSDKATAILSEARVVSDATTQHLQDVSQELLAQHNARVQDISQQIIQDYTKLLNEEKTTDVKSLQDIASQMESNLTSQLTDFNQQLNNHLSLLTASLSADVKSKYDKADQDVEIYKKMKIQKVEESIFNILEDISIQVLGKSINLTDTEAFIEKTVKEKFNEML